MRLLTVLAALVPEGHIAPSDPRSKLAVPVGILVFVGGVYLLLRSNLGTRRGYLVLGVSLWGFTTVFASMWAFGAPGTLPGGGPLNLPGQQIDEYEPQWKAFAADSAIAADPRYDIVADYPQGFGPVPADFQDRAALGSNEVRNFFSGFGDASPYTNIVGPTWAALTDRIGYAVSDGDPAFPILAVPYVPTYQLAPVEGGAQPLLTVDGAPPAADGGNVAPAGSRVGDPVAGAAPVLLFGYFDRGSPLFPSYVVFGVILGLFVLHVALLAHDEKRERRERDTPATPAQQPTPAPAPVP
ncbi:MAG: hypothetical protein ACRD0K_09670 [Egibacteraceae bacterium]